MNLDLSPSATPGESGEFVDYKLSGEYTHRGRTYGPTTARVPRDVAVKDAYLQQRQKLLDGGTPIGAIPSLSTVLERDRASRAAETAGGTKGKGKASGAPSGAGAPTAPAGAPAGPGTDAGAGQAATGAIGEDFPHAAILADQGIRTFEALREVDGPKGLTDIGDARWAEIQDGLKAADEAGAAG